MHDPLGERGIALQRCCGACGATWKASRHTSARTLAAPLGVFFMFMGLAIVLDRILAESSSQPTHITALGGIYMLFGALTLILALRFSAPPVPPIHCNHCGGPMVAVP